MEDDDSLFGDLGVASITRKTHKDIRQQCIDEAWKLWVDKTQRPPSKTPERKFAEAYGNMLDLKYTHERLIRCVAGAAFLPPRPRDPVDTRRVVMVLNSTKHEAEALSLLDSGEAEVFPWAWNDELDLLSSIKSIEKACGIDLSDWTEQEHEYAGILATSVDEQRLNLAVERTRLHLGEDYVFPSEIVRHSALWRNENVKLSVKTNAKRDTYGAGKHESSLLENMELGADLLAEKLLIRGCPAEAVRAFYDLAPEGYWDEVVDKMEKDITLSIQKIYDSMEDEYGFHPSKRELPKW